MVKTTDSSTGVKAFINICSNQHIAKAWSQFAEREENGKKLVLTKEQTFGM